MKEASGSLKNDECIACSWGDSVFVFSVYGNVLLTRYDKFCCMKKPTTNEYSIYCTSKDTIVHQRYGLFMYVLNSLSLSLYSLYLLPPPLTPSLFEWNRSCNDSRSYYVQVP